MASSTTSRENGFKVKEAARITEGSISNELESDTQSLPFSVIGSSGGFVLKPNERISVSLAIDEVLMVSSLTAIGPDSLKIDASIVILHPGLEESDGGKSLRANVELIEIFGKIEVGLRYKCAGS